MRRVSLQGGRVLPREKLGSRWEVGKLLVLERQGDLVGGNCAFAKDHPGVAAAGEIDDGGGGRAAGGAAVDD